MFPVHTVRNSLSYACKAYDKNNCDDKFSSEVPSILSAFPLIAYTNKYLVDPATCVCSLAFTVQHGRGRHSLRLPGR